MNRPLHPRLAFALSLTFALASAASLFKVRAADEGGVIHISDHAQKTIPIALTGFSGEAAQVLRFDLEVAGFDVVPVASAQYELKGVAGANVQGALSDTGNHHTLFARAYPGGTTRAQAHTLSDDVVKAVTGKPGIARTRIAFKVDLGRSKEIYVADYDGGNPFRATEDNSIAASPSWVPGKLRLFYTSYRGGGPAVYTHDLQTAARTRVFGFNGLNTSAAVSPDGTRVAVILSKSGSPDLWVANIDGSGLRQLTKTHEPESSPCWSPDGRTICFASTRDGKAALFTVPAAGGEMRRLSTGGIIPATEPDWSPDGQSIVFTRAGGSFDLYLIPATGGTAELLTSGEDPSWAPNSRTIIFTRGRDGARRLSLLDVPTRRVKDVNRISGSSSQPSWAR
jgi:TolB protein